MKLFSFLIPIVFILFSCQSKHESLVSEIEDLISKEKYEKALALLQDRLSANRSTSEILSKINQTNLGYLLFPKIEPKLFGQKTKLYFSKIWLMITEIQLN